MLIQNRTISETLWNATDPAVIAEIGIGQASGGDGLLHLTGWGYPFDVLPGDDCRRWKTTRRRRCDRLSGRSKVPDRWTARHMRCPGAQVSGGAASHADGSPA